MFSLAAIIFSMATIWGSLLIIALLLLLIELFAELIGLAGKDYKPILKFMRPRAQNSRYDDRL